MTVTVYGLANTYGGHDVEVGVGDDFRVSIRPRGPEHDAAALDLASAIVDASAVQAQIEVERRAREEDRAAANATFVRLSAERDAAHAALRAAVEGRRRFFGPVLCMPATEDDWSGEVWLLDPDKRESGFGLRFKSLAEVRERHPELWIVGVVNGGVLLDAARLPEAPR